MKQIRIKRIDPMQSGKVYFILTLIICIIFVAPILLFISTMGAAAGLGNNLNLGSAGMGIGLILGIVIFYSIFGFIIGFLSALLYNFTYKFHNGILYEAETTEL